MKNSDSIREANRKRKNNDLEQKEGSKKNRVDTFLSLSSQGPTFVCICCQRCMYERSVLNFNIEKYKDDLVRSINILDGLNFICRTCHLTMKKEKLPAQAVSNKLEIFKSPELIINLNRLESVLISRRILF